MWGERAIVLTRSVCSLSFCERVRCFGHCVEAIREYWDNQIAGKQSNIGFRHVVGDMVLDSEKRKAVVKWLAEFDNVRYRISAAAPALLASTSIRFLIHVLKALVRPTQVSGTRRNAATSFKSQFWSSLLTSRMGDVIWYSGVEEFVPVGVGGPRSSST